MLFGPGFVQLCDSCFQTGHIRRPYRPSSGGGGWGGSVQGADHDVTLMFWLWITCRFEQTKETSRKKADRALNQKLQRRGGSTSRGRGSAQLCDRETEKADGEATHSSYRTAEFRFPTRGNQPQSCFAALSQMEEISDVFCPSVIRLLNPSLDRCWHQCGPLFY